MENSLEFDLVCPITLQPFENPVIAADGHTYERDAIVECIARSGISPITREPLDSNTLRPNYIIKNLIDELKKRNTNASPQAPFVSEEPGSYDAERQRKPRR